jgi:hypothetical protein
MNTRLVQLQQRIQQLEALAQDIGSLAERYYRDENVFDDLSLKGQRWYRASRELLSQHGSSGLEEFEKCYSASDDPSPGRLRVKTAYYDLEPVLSAKNRQSIGMTLEQFQWVFRKARTLVVALEDELLSRELPVVTQLSSLISADEFDKADQLLSENRGDEVLLRAAGVIARVALERHLFTVADARGLTIVVNPASKKKHDVSDVLNTLVKAGVITPVQRSQADSLFAVANNCAHPKEAVTVTDVERLIRDGRALAATVL